MATKLLHFVDAYMKDCSAVVTSVSEFDGKFLVTLDQTCFYPESGGQPSDWGELTVVSVHGSDEQGSVYKVSSVYKFKGTVPHVVDKPGLKVGDRVVCKIDWDDRYRNMQFHTAIHIVTSLIEKENDILVSSNNATLEKARIDFTLEDFDREYLSSFEAKANEVLAKNLPVKKFFLSREDASKSPELFRLLKGFDESIQDIHIVQIGDDAAMFDKSACGGAHVNNTSEIPKIKFLKLENKGAKRRRINFTFV